MEAYLEKVPQTSKTNWISVYAKKLKKINIYKWVKLL